MSSDKASAPLLEPERDDGWPRRSIRQKIVNAIVFGIVLLFILEATETPVWRDWLGDRSPWARAPHRGDGGDSHKPPQDDDDPYKMWQSIEPSTELFWEPCFPSADGNFFCSRLTVPMDYHRPLDADHPEHPQVHLALVLLPGKNSTFCNGGRFNPSPILFNPGGPGGSGTSLVTAVGKTLQMVVGPHHDLIGFDPRGIGSSQPKANCFLHGHSKDDPVTSTDENVALLRRVTYELSRHDVGLVNSSDVALAKVDTHHRAIARLCAEYDEELGDDSIFRYVGTPNVARDMLSIVEAWDRYTDKMDMAGREHMMDTRGKLVYWGFSYGTLLGATYAAMFPDKVGRVILDGVVDADLYVGETWLQSLRDTDYIQEKFYDYCAKAESDCRLWRKGDEAADVKARFEGVLARLRAEPLHVVHPAAHMPIVVSYSDVKAVMFVSLYSPSRIFPIVATLLDLLARQIDLSPLLTALDLSAFCLARNLTLPMYPDDGGRGVMCSDKRYALNESIPALEKRFEGFANYSNFADVWMDVALSCDGWEVASKDPPMRWDDQPTKRQKPIKTSFPVLFLGNTHDPVTPLFAAVKMASKFQDAGLVEQRSEGHCTLSAVSICTMAKIDAYLNRGEVPPPPTLKKKGDFSAGEWEVCEANEYPWKRWLGPGLDATVRSDGTVGTAQLSDHVYNLVTAAGRLQRRMVPFLAEGHASLVVRGVAEKFSLFLYGDEALLDETMLRDLGAAAELYGLN